MSIAYWQLAVKNLQESLTFYCNGLGFELSNANNEQAELTLGGGGSKLRLIHSPHLNAPYSSQKDQCYWKIGLTVSNLENTLTQLSKQGINATRPQQFLDIGYLCHLSCPDGYIIELLQFTAKDSPLSQNHRFDKQWAHITFRVSDGNVSINFFRETLALSLIETIAVAPYHFDLYFLSENQDKRPKLTTIGEKRHWLWTRPNTLIELQHSHTPAALDTTAIKSRKMELGIGLAEQTPLLSPDGIPITFVD